MARIRFDILPTRDIRNPLHPKGAITTSRGAWYDFDEQELVHALRAAGYALVRGQARRVVGHSMIGVYELQQGLFAADMLDGAQQHARHEAAWAAVEGAPTREYHQHERDQFNPHVDVVCSMLVIDEPQGAVDAWNLEEFLKQLGKGR